ncbi:MAG TPA: DNA polymerase III subunit gamma/tau [Pyrinomonadaceae bacterium]|nr:DNA polymerase III subunit gamma/tau [Pyrinomonadaceae bacterium]
MSYQVIARKWRPQTFEEVTGQEAITRTLRNAVEHERLHHAYLFSGARGVGKTTTARLLAKALNCHKTAKPNPVPCLPSAADACVSCREIAEGRSIDVLEFDAASNTQVDKIRDLIIENINISSARDRYKIFIIDEVHMLSTSSFNALLKTLEEPPPRVVFIMATTELHKVPDTILSRCQEFQFRTIPLQKIFDRLKVIAEAEKINIVDEALREIARAGEGSMRDAQSAFDQVISFSGDKIETADVTSALGVASTEMLVRCVRAIAENLPVEALRTVDDLVGRGQDLRSFCRDLMSLFRDLLVVKMAGEVENLFDSAVLSRAELRQTAEPFTEADLIRFFNSLSETESKLREATQARYVLEVGLVKLIEMRRVAPIEKILERLAHLENALGNGNLQAEAKSEPAVEKKKLEIDFPLEEVPFPVSSVVANGNSAEIEMETMVAAVEVSPVLEEPAFFSSRPVEEEPEIVPDLPPSIEKFAAFLPETFPVKLPPISSEDLEHVEDNWLDTAYELKLQRSGDNLYQIENVSTLVEALLKNSQTEAFSPKGENSNGGSAAAFAPAKEKPKFVIPSFETEEETEEIPELPENATDEELWRYAENHPLTKRVLRIFRGKLVEVKRL